MHDSHQNTSSDVHFSRRKFTHQTPGENTNDNQTFPDINCHSSSLGNILLKGRQKQFVLYRKDNKLTPPKKTSSPLPPIKNGEHLKRESRLTSRKPRFSNLNKGSSGSSLYRSCLSEVEQVLSNKHKLVHGHNTAMLTNTVSFRQQLSNFRHSVDTLFKAYGNLDLLTRDFIEKIVLYVTLLTKNHQHIMDSNIFSAVLIQRMNMKANPEQLLVLYKALVRKDHGSESFSKCNRGNPPPGDLHVDSFCRFVCMLLTEDATEKANVIYSIFDRLDHGYITEYDLNEFIEPLIQSFGEHVDHEEIVRHRLSVHTLTTAAMNLIDKNGDKKIERHEFIRSAKEDGALLDAFGLVLPDRSDMQGFVDMLKAHEEKDIHCVFRHERRILLRSKFDENESFIQSLYPVTLQFC